MIRLDVEDYCQNCPEFDPCLANEYIISSFDGNHDELNRDVTCGHRRRCEEMYKRIEGAAKGRD